MVTKKLTEKKCTDTKEEKFIKKSSNSKKKKVKKRKTHPMRKAKYK